MNASRHRFGRLLLMWAIWVMMPKVAVVVADSIPRDPRRDQDTGESLLIGTLNLQTLVFPASAVVDECCTDLDDRLEIVTEQIVRSNYDIITFQEVFDEDDLLIFEDVGKDVLVERLKLNFPNYVEYLDYGPLDLKSDSGLMLFSRFPFEPLPTDTHKAEDVSAVNEGEDWDDVGFFAFTKARGFFDSGGDDLANKGVGYVRVRNPYSERIYNIFFCHLDAGGDDRDIRASQMREIEAFIRESVPDFESEDILVLGDFNINGDLMVTRDEWRAELRMPFFSIYESPSGRIAGPDGPGILCDMWNYGMHNDVAPRKQDRGWTTSADQPGKSPRDRVDYIFHNSAVASRQREAQEPFLEFQHMTLAYNLYSEGSGMLGAGGGMTFSDHVGVNANINQYAPHCSSQEARVVTELDFDSKSTAVFDDSFQILVPGGMQWLRVDSPGTYSVAIRSGDERGDELQHHVYASKEMSQPMMLALDDEVTFFDDDDDDGGQYSGRRFHVPPDRVPFYVRVRHPDRSWFGDCKIALHRLPGTSQSSAISLSPGQPQAPPPLPPGAIAADGTWTRWFRIDTDTAYSGMPQTLTFSTEHPEDYVLEIRGSDGRTTLDGPRSGPIERTDAADNLTTLYLLVRPVGGASATPKVQWTTNLKVLTITGVRCLTKTDGGGGLTDDDDVRLQLILDGRSFRRWRIEWESDPTGVPVWGEGREPYLGDFGNGTAKTSVAVTSQLPPIGYLERFRPVLTEVDTGGHDWLLGFPFEDFDTMPGRTEIISGAVRQCMLLEYDKGDDGVFRLYEDGKYSIDFTVFRGTQQLELSTAVLRGGEPVARIRGSFEP